MALRVESVPDASSAAVRIGPLKRRHLRSVLRIEQQVYPRPWTLAVFHGELAQGSQRCYLVARVGAKVVGYAGVMFVDGDAHVTNIAVDPAWHRHGIGTRLLVVLASQARVRGARNLTLEVRVSNVAAQEMYRRFGFAPAGMRRRYYENTEDAIVMWANDIDQPAYADRLAGLLAPVQATTMVEGLA